MSRQAVRLNNFSNFFSARKFLLKENKAVSAMVDTEKRNIQFGILFFLEDEYCIFPCEQFLFCIKVSIDPVGFFRNIPITNPSQSG